MKLIALPLIALWVWLGSGHHPVFAATYRLVDQEGVVYFTNAPSSPKDPRYQRLKEWSGTAQGWLRLPGFPVTRYSAEIGQAAERYGVDARLVEAVISVESAFDPWAVSREGAQGLMQLMPRTAAVLGVRDSFNPRQNIAGGVRYLRALLNRYNGDLALALAAYNAGPHVVEWYRGVPPYPETQQYVKRVLERYLARLNGGASLAPQIIYRYEDAAGTVTYTNIPPRPSHLGSAPPTR